MAVVTRYVNTASTAGGDGTTNNTTGATRAYASLSEWESNEQTDLVTDGDSHVCLVDGSGGEDTTSTLIAGWTTGASNDITIRAEGDQRCNGFSRDKTGTGYKIRASSTPGAIRVNTVGHVTLDGFELEVDGSSSHTLATSSVTELRIFDMFMSGDEPDLSSRQVMDAMSISDYLEVRNSIFIASGNRRGIRNYTGPGGPGPTTTVIDHCGIYCESNDSVCVVNTGSTVTNTWSISNGTADAFTGGGGTPSGSHNASSDTSASSEFSSSYDNIVAADEFINPTTTLSTVDFRLEIGSSLIDAGTGSEPTDIVDNARVGTVDVGPFERRAATGSAISQDSQVSGSATILITGSGSLESSVCTVSGSAARVTTGTGTLLSQDASVVGSAFSETSGRLVAQSSSVSGSASIPVISATGSLLAGPSSLGVIPASPIARRSITVPAENRVIVV